MGQHHLFLHWSPSLSLSSSSSSSSLSSNRHRNLQPGNSDSTMCLEDFFLQFYMSNAFWKPINQWCEALPGCLSQPNQQLCHQEYLPECHQENPIQWYQRIEVANLPDRESILFEEYVKECLDGSDHDMIHDQQLWYMINRQWMDPVRKGNICCFKLIGKVFRAACWFQTLSVWSAQVC